jgi:hypothetical protein
MTPLVGGIIGFLLGLLLCYWKQLQTAYQKRDLIGSGADLITAGGNFLDQLKKI